VQGRLALSVDAMTVVSTARGAIPRRNILAQGTTLGCASLMAINVNNHAHDRSARRGASDAGEGLAIKILQDYLDHMGVAVMAGRFEDYAPLVILPFNLVTEASSLWIETLEDLAETFDAFADQLVDLGVTRFERRAIRALAPCPDTLHGQYRSVMLAGNRPVAPPHYSQIWLRRIDGVWMSSKIRNSTTACRLPVLPTSTSYC